MRKPNFLAHLATLVLCVAGLLGASVSASAQSTPLHERTTSYRYDGVGRMVGEIAPDPDGDGDGESLERPAVRTTYDPNGLVLRVESGTLDSWQSNSVAPKNWPGFTVLQTVQNTYDTLGQLVKTEVKGEDGQTVSVVQSNYDRVGRPGCSAVRMDPTSFGALPANACTKPNDDGEFGPDRITRNFYDDAGQLLQVRKAVDTDDEIADVTYSYTDNGQIKEVVDANGNRAELRYDGHDRQTAWVFPAKERPTGFVNSNPQIALQTAGALSTADGINGTDDVETYAYDNNGNRTRLTKRDGSVINYRYDALNRMTVKDLPDTLPPGRPDLPYVHRRDIHYSYDLRGLVTRVGFYNRVHANAVRYKYDGFGRLLEEEQQSDGRLRIVKSQYDANSNRTRLTFPDNAYASFTYDKLDRLDRVKQGGSTLGGVVYNQRGLPEKLEWPVSASSSNERIYDYDNVGRVDEIVIDLHGTSHDVTWDYMRNPASQIRSEIQSNDTYSWDAHEDVAQRNYVTNGLNQYESAGPSNFTYDDNGNLTSDGTYTYLYDIENRLVRRTGGGYTTELYYDPTGRLFQILSDNPASAGRTHFAYDGNALIGEYNVQGTMLRRYVHGSNAEADDPLIWYEGAAMNSTTRRYVHADPRGSIVAVTNRQGTTIATNTYDEYGIPDEDTQNPSGDTIAEKGRFRYTGQAWLPELGMYYYKARIYSPTLGRFLQTDPIGYEDQFNLYAYVGNDPINGVDPSGENGEHTAEALAGLGQYILYQSKRKSLRNRPGQWEVEARYWAASFRIQGYGAYAIEAEKESQRAGREVRRRLSRVYRDAGGTPRQERLERFAQQQGWSVVPGRENKTTIQYQDPRGTIRLELKPHAAVNATGELSQGPRATYTDASGKRYDPLTGIRINSRNGNQVTGTHRPMVRGRRPR